MEYLIGIDHGKDDYSAVCIARDDGNVIEIIFQTSGDSTSVLAEADAWLARNLLDPDTMTVLEE